MKVLKNIQLKAQLLIAGKPMTDEQMHPSNRLLLDTISEEGLIMPVSQLDDIAAQTFEIDNYEEFMRFLILQLEKELNSSKIIKLLIVSDYLLKNGCSGCIDDLRDHLYIFRYYSKFNEKKSEELQNIIRKKAQHICQLLQNKAQLQKEKLIQMQIKQKLKESKVSQIYGIGSNNNNENNTTASDTESTSSSTTMSGSTKLLKNIKAIIKVNDLVENYFYKYLDEMNEKLDDVTETISTKVDKYINFIQKKLQHPSESDNGLNKILLNLDTNNKEKESDGSHQQYEPAIGTDILEFAEFEQNPLGETIQEEFEEEKIQSENQEEYLKKQAEELKKREEDMDKLQMIDLLEIDHREKQKQTYQMNSPFY